MDEVKQISVSYKKLWKLLVDKEMKKKDLRIATGFSTTSMAKLAKNQNVSTQILVRVCRALNCDMSDVIEIAADKEN